MVDTPQNNSRSQEVHTMNLSDDSQLDILASDHEDSLVCFKSNIVILHPRSQSHWIKTWLRLFTFFTLKDGRGIYLLWTSLRVEVSIIWAKMAQKLIGSKTFIWTSLFPKRPNFLTSDYIYICETRSTIISKKTRFFKISNLVFCNIQLCNQL